MNFVLVLPPPAAIGALFTFIAIASITPGPNNIMLTASGVNFGIRRTVPHMIGIWFGCISVMIAAGLGLGVLFTTVPALRVALQAVCTLYVLWLAWKIATAGTFGMGDAAHPHPFPFLGAAAFQWVNPKLWVIAISAMAIYVRPDHVVTDAALVTLASAIVNIPCMLIWAGFGVALRDFLRAPGRTRIFNIVMGGLLALTVLALLRP